MKKYIYIIVILFIAIIQCTIVYSKPSKSTTTIGIVNFQNLTKNSYFDYLRDTIPNEIISRTSDCKDICYADRKKLNLIFNGLLANEIGEYNDIQLKEALSNLESMDNISLEVIILGTYVVDDDDIITLKIKYWNYLYGTWINTTEFKGNINFIFDFVGKIIIDMLEKVNTIRAKNAPIIMDDAFKNKVTENKELNWEIYKTFKDVHPALKEGNFSSAIIDSERTLSKDPDYLPAYETLAIAYEQLGEYKLALTYYLKYLEKGPQIIGYDKVSDVFDEVAKTKEYISDYPSAVNDYKTSINLENKIGDKKRLAERYLSLGKVYNAFGNYKKAVDLLSKAHPIIKSDCSEVELFECLLEIGKALRNNLQKRDSETVFKYIKEMMVAHYDKLREGYVLKEWALLDVKKEDIENAIVKLEEALEIFENYGNTQEMLDCTLNLGIIYHSKCDYELAKSLFEQGAEISKKYGFRMFYGTFMFYIGYINEQDPTKSRPDMFYLTSEDVTYTYRIQQEQAILFHQLGLLHEKLGNKKKSYYFYNKAMLINSDLGNYNYLINQYIYLANLYASNGEKEVAMLNFKKAIKMAKYIKDKMLIGITYNNLGKYLLKRKHLNNANDALSNAIKYQYEIKDWINLSDSLFNQGIIKYKLEAFDKALELAKQANKIDKDFKLPNEIQSRKMVEEIQERINLIEQTEKELKKKIPPKKNIKSKLK